MWKKILEENYGPILAVNSDGDARRRAASRELTTPLPENSQFHSIGKWDGGELSTGAVMNFDPKHLIKRFRNQALSAKGIQTMIGTITKEHFKE